MMMRDDVHNTGLYTVWLIARMFRRQQSYTPLTQPTLSLDDWTTNCSDRILL